MRFFGEEELFEKTEETAAQIRRRRFRRFILLLVFSLMLTSSMIGYLIGRIVYIDYYTGQIVDTITIDFGQPAVTPEPETMYQINVVGIVQYTDGTPYASGTIELRSETRYTTTDAFGHFEFLDVEEGHHSLSVVRDGVVLATTSVNFQLDAFINVRQIVKLDTGGYLIRIPLQVEVLSVILEIDPNGGTGTGIGEENRDDLVIKFDFDNEVGVPTEPTDPVDPTDPVGPVDPVDPVGPTEPVDPDNPGGSIEPEDPTVPTDPVDPPPPPPPPPPPTVDPPEDTTPRIYVSDDYTMIGRNWQKITSVDIFAPRVGNTGVQSLGGNNVIAPGSHGRFIFKVRNPQLYDVDITIDLVDSDANVPNIPMIYRLKRGINGDDYVGGNAWRTASEIVEFIKLPNSTSVYYTLEWEWDGSNNTVDTAIGNQINPPLYILEILVTGQ